jgi:hypothetical protein
MQNLNLSVYTKYSKDSKIKKYIPSRTGQDNQLNINNLKIFES